MRSKLRGIYQSGRFRVALQEGGLTSKAILHGPPPALVQLYHVCHGLVRKPSSEQEHLETANDATAVRVIARIRPDRFFGSESQRQTECGGSQAMPWPRMLIQSALAPALRGGGAPHGSARACPDRIAPRLERRRRCKPLVAA
jgi:hypothetical protein